MQVRSPREFGALIRDHRKAAGWSQTELAAKIGTSRSWISEVENGKETAEIGLMLRALQVLGLRVEVHARRREEYAAPATKAATPWDESGDASEPRTERPLLTRRGKSLALSRMKREGGHGRG